MTTNNHHKPRRVDFFLFKEDFETAYMGALGFSTRAIQSMTKMTPGKITYRLKKASIKRMDYRNGESAIATTVLRSLRPTVTRQVTHFLKTGTEI